MSIQKPRRREPQRPDRLSRDDVFSILSNRRRRDVLRYLRRDAESASLGDLAERIAAWENDIPVAEVDYKQRKRVYTSLHQTHLPKLDEAGIVEYDRNRGTITLTDRAAELEAYLSTPDEREVPWDACYLGLSALALGLLVAAWLGVVSGMAAAGLTVALFVVVAGANAYVARRDRIGGHAAAEDSGTD